MFLTKQLLVVIDFHSIFPPIQWKSMATSYILQNIFFCVQQKKVSHKGLEQHEDE